jgi:hypothetical protein
MSKRSIRKNRHREDKGLVRKTWPCVRRGELMTYTDCVVTVGDESFPLKVDRIVPELGYVKGNVIVVSCRANRIKSDATPDELERIASAVRAATMRSRLMRAEVWVP